MFYRIKNNEVYDYADYEYAPDCKYTSLCTMQVFDKDKDNYIISCGEIIVNPNLCDLLANKRQAQFEKEFFQTSLGWIRRKVTMKDGSQRDFLADLLPAIKAGIELGQNVEMITYKTPDYASEMTMEYIKSLQEIKTATIKFVQECLIQTVKDFGLESGVYNGISD